MAFKYGDRRGHLRGDPATGDRRSRRPPDLGRYRSTRRRRGKARTTRPDFVAAGTKSTCSRIAGADAEGFASGTPCSIAAMRKRLADVAEGFDATGSDCAWRSGCSPVGLGLLAPLKSRNKVSRPSPGRALRLASENFEPVTRCTSIKNHSHFITEFQ